MNLIKVSIKRLFIFLAPGQAHSTIYIFVPFFAYQYFEMCIMKDLYKNCAKDILFRNKEKTEYSILCTSRTFDKTYGKLMAEVSTEKATISM